MTSNLRQRYWVTKWALTKGIFEVEAVPTQGYGTQRTKPPTLIRVRPGFLANDVLIAIGVDAFSTEKDARRNLLFQARKRLKAREKEMAELRELVASLEKEFDETS